MVGGQEGRRGRLEPKSKLSTTSKGPPEPSNSHDRWPPGPTQQDRCPSRRQVRSAETLPSAHMRLLTGLHLSLGRLVERRHAHQLVCPSRALCHTRHPADPPLTLERGSTSKRPCQSADRLPRSTLAELTPSLPAPALASQAVKQILLWKNELLAPQDQFIVADIDACHLVIKTSEVIFVEQQLNEEVRPCSGPCRATAARHV